MIETVDARAQLSREDLLTNARLIEGRAKDPEAERERLLLVRRFIAASFDLNRALRAQTECALVNHYGTTGTRSLVQATQTMFEALAEYARQCRRLAEEGRSPPQSGPERSWSFEGNPGLPAAAH